MFYGGGNQTKINPNNKPLTSDFVSLHLKGRTDGFALKGADATQGKYEVMYDGVRPDHRSAPNNCHWHGVNGSYQPMRKQVFTHFYIVRSSSACEVLIRVCAVLY